MLGGLCFLLSLSLPSSLFAKDRKIELAEPTSNELDYIQKPIIVVTEIGKPEKDLIESQKKKVRSSSTKKTLPQASKPVRVFVSANGYARGHCTSYAASRRPDLPSNLGNARTWVSRAKAQGISTGKEAKVGSIVQTSESRLGHVAFVEAVEEGFIVVSEQNYKGIGIVSSRKIPIGSGVIRGYIY